MKPKNIGICEDCAYWDDPDEKNIGVCKRRSPVTDHVFPEIGHDGWCGDWIKNDDI